MNKHSKIYTHDKYSMLDEIVKTGKNSPGVGKYNVSEFFEKRVKPPRGYAKASEQKITNTDDVINFAKA